MQSVYDPNVLVSAALTMQRIQNAVCGSAYRSHTHYVSGVVHVSKALALARKLDERFGVSLSDDQKYRLRKNHNRCTFRFYMYPIDETDSLDWILIRTAGEHPELESENWKCFRTAGERLVFHGFELIELPYTHREIEAQKSLGRTLNPTSWTWQMTREKYQGFQKRARTAVNHLKKTKGANTLPYEQLLFSLARCPGFRKVNDQIWDLRGYVNECRRRVKLPHDTFLPISPLRKRKCAEYPLSLLVQRWQDGESSFFPPPTRGVPSGVVTHTVRGKGTE